MILLARVLNRGDGLLVRLLSQAYFRRSTLTSGGLTMKFLLRVTLLLLAFATSRRADALADATKIQIEVHDYAAGIIASKCDAVADNLVGNCGFETGDYYRWLPQQPPCFCAVTEASRFSGNFGLEYGPTDLAHVAQLLATVPGQQYSLSFLLRNTGNQFSEHLPTILQPNLFRVYWDGVIIYELADAPEIPWMSIQVDGLLASRPISELRFGFYNPEEWWYFDDVVVLPSSN